MFTPPKPSTTSTTQTFTQTIATADKESDKGKYDAFLRTLQFSAQLKFLNILNELIKKPMYRE